MERVRSKVLLAGYGLVLLGWMLAVVIGHGFDLHRMAVAAIGLVPGAALVAAASSRGRVLSGWAVGVLGVVALFLSLRGVRSPVWDLARPDLILIFSFVICFVSSARVLGTPAGRGMLLIVLGAVILGHLGVGLYQQFVDSEFAVLRPPRSNQDGVSGLFWHRNYLAGMLAFLVPVAVALAIKSRSPASTVGFALLAVIGALLTLLTKSRAGVLALTLGVFVVPAMVIYRRSFKWKARLRGAVAVGVMIMGLAAFGGAAMMASKISERRGGSADLSAALEGDSRLGLAGLAFEQWRDAPPLGTGSRTFSYEAVIRWDEANLSAWPGNPVMVHNDYLQCLAEYGALGLIGLLTVALILGGRILLPGGIPDNGGTADQGLSAIQIGAAGALAAAMTHSVFDFSLHILPNVMLLGLLTGSLGIAGPARRDRPSSGRGAGAIGITLLLAAAAGLGATTWRDLSMIGKWFVVERRLAGRKPSLDREGAAAIRRLFETAPEFRVARNYGAAHLRLYQRDPEANAEALGEAVEALRIATERHPYDGESLINYAMALGYRGEFEKAAGYYVRAVEVTGRRENKYGAMRRFSELLWRWGEKEWLGRRPARALGLFIRSQQFLARAWERRAPGLTGGSYRRLAAKRERRIDFLKAAGIDAEFPEGVPAPPRPSRPAGWNR